jgi:hypothetical protein
MSQTHKKDSRHNPALEGGPRHFCLVINFRLVNEQGRQGYDLLIPFFV